MNASLFAWPSAFRLCAREAQAPSPKREAAAALSRPNFPSPRLPHLLSRMHLLPDTHLRPAAPDRGFTPPTRASYRDLKLPRVSAAFGELLGAARGRFAAGDAAFPPAIRPGWPARANREPRCPRYIEPPSPRGSGSISCWQALHQRSASHRRHLRSPT